MQYINQFESISGMTLAGDFKIIKSGSSYAETALLKAQEGEFYLIVKGDPDQIDALLAADPPFGQKWFKGPIPGEYGLFITFGYKNEGYGKGQYFGSTALVDVLSSPDIYYCARGKTFPPDTFYRNGQILIIDQKKNKLLFSHWDS